jgi:predicted transporter
MTEIILVLTISIISVGLLVWIAMMSTKFFKYFNEIIGEIIDEQKKNQ